MKRLLLRVLKWVVVPVALVLVGYLVVAPALQERMMRPASASDTGTGTAP